MDDTAGTITESERVRGRIDELLDRRKDDFDAKYQENEDKLGNLTRNVKTLDDELIDLNDMVSSVKLR